VDQTSEGIIYAAWPAGVAQMDGFAVATTIGWHSVRCSVEFGSFAGDLMAATSKSDDSQRASFKSFAQMAAAAGGQVQFELDDVPSEALVPGTWPGSWQRLSLRLVRAPVETADGSPQRALELAKEWSELVTGMVVSLLPLESVAASPAPDVVGLPEGAMSRVTVNRYERNPVNRALCLASNGTACKACGFDFGRSYGPLGQGFIEVHHRIPVAQMGSEYSIDPATDLVPLCPNCHAMIHRRTPPLDVGELAQLIAGVGAAELPEELERGRTEANDE